METEQRCDEKRIEISRPVEIIDPEVGLGQAGYTKNLSNSGMRARFETVPNPGEIVQLEVTLADDVSPLATMGKVIWCAPDIFGGGSEVGLKFVGEEEVTADEATEAASEVDDGAGGPLRLGQRVTIEADGQSLGAVVDAVSPDSQEREGVYMVSLTVEPRDAIDNDEILADEWKPHPIRDALDLVRRYGAPVLAVLAGVAVPTGRVLARWLTGLWTRLPAGPRRKVQGFFEGLQIGKRLSALKRAVVSAALTAKARIRPRLEAIFQRLTGDES